MPPKTNQVWKGTLKKPAAKAFPCPKGKAKAKGTYRKKGNKSPLPGPKSGKQFNIQLFKLFKLSNF